MTTPTSINGSFAPNSSTTGYAADASDEESDSDSEDDFIASDSSDSSEEEQQDDGYIGTVGDNGNEGSHLDIDADGYAHTSSKVNPSCCHLRPRTTPFPEGKSILGVIYGVLLWADMNAADGTVYNLRQQIIRPRTAAAVLRRCCGPPHTTACWQTEG